MVADLEIGNTLTELFDDARTLVAAEDREARHRDAAGHEVMIGVTHSGCFHPDLDLVRLGITDLDLFDLPRRVQFSQQRTLGLHSCPPLVVVHAQRAVGAGTAWRPY